MGLAATDLVIKHLVDASLTRPIALGPVFLVLVHNHAFVLGLGASLPPTAVTLTMAAVTIFVAAQLWRRGAGGSSGFALVLAGALSNLADRATDGSVVDYLQVPGWPAFNLADVFVIGGALLIAGEARAPGPRDEEAGRRAPADSTAPPGGDSTG